MYIAHTHDGKTYDGVERNCQPLSEHLLNVAKLAAKYAEPFGGEKVADVLGLLHDIGKYSEAFQKRIRKITDISVNHKIDGVKVLIEKYGDVFGWLYGMAIAGHHGGLKDSGNSASMADSTYCGMINENKDRPINTVYTTEITLPEELPIRKLRTDRNRRWFATAFYIKMLYSALVDADWTDTEEFVTKVTRDSNHDTIDTLLQKLQENIPQNNGRPINVIRAGILEDCIRAAKKPRGMFRLTVPTGGGKTISSLAFALYHAKARHLRRVIYVIPYTSIIEQNARVFKEILGVKNVLEHHSSLLTAEIEAEENIRMKWAMDNWDIPVVVTTNVQFFESIYAHKPSQCRKLHNLTDSVIVFDEVQMLPSDYLTPCLYAISELVKNYGVSAVLCSATQPAIDRFLYPDMPIREICHNPQELAEKLQRVQYEIVGEKTDDEIIELLQGNKQALVVLNSRKHAYHLYTLAQSRLHTDIVHLSTVMCPAHRRAVIADIRKKLVAHTEVIVISTQLIEAGVDLDFPLVIRSAAGIDSIIQAGGRANREGKLPFGRVVVFHPKSTFSQTPRTLQNAVSIGNEVLQLHDVQAFALQGIEQYFRLLYAMRADNQVIDKKDIMGEFGEMRFNYETASEKFKIIESNTYDIVIPLNDKARSLIQTLRENTFNTHTLRRLAQYTVSIYENEYRKLQQVIEVVNGVRVLANENYYNKVTGLEIFTEDNKNAEAFCL